MQLILAGYLAAALALAIGLTLWTQFRFSIMRIAARNAAWVALIWPIIWLVVVTFAKPRSASDQAFLRGGTVIVPVGYFVWILVALRYFRLSEKRRRRAQGTLVCQRCGYDLRGNPGAPCPECGKQWKRDVRRRR